MKKYSLMFFSMIILTTVSIAQIGTVQPIVNNARNDIMQFIQKLTFAVKTNNKTLLQNCFLNAENTTTVTQQQGKTTTSKADKTYSDFKITVHNISVINTKSADLSCEIFLKDSLQPSSHKFTIKLVKKNNRWYISNTPDNTQSVSLLSATKLANVQSDSPFSIRYSNTAMIQVKQIEDPVIWEINSGVTNQYLQRQLFSNNTEIDMEIYWFGNNWPADCAAFALDPTWQRIIYSKGSSQDILSYGDNPGDYHFSYPLGITATYNGYLYVADTGNKKIVKLYYNSSTNQLSFVSTLNIPSLGNPVDISYCYAYGTQILWILEGNGGRLLKTDMNGNILAWATQYDYLGNTYNFNNPIRIYGDKQYSDDIYLLDNTSKTLMRGNIFTNGHFGTGYLVNFPQNSILTDVGTNNLGELLVSDSYYNCIHIISSYGNYTCSFNYSAVQNPAFQYPQRLSSYNNNRPGWLIIDNSTADRWTSSYGLKRYLSGADVFDLSFQQQGSNYIFGYFAATHCQIRIDILQNGNVIKTQNFEALEGTNQWQVPTNQLPQTTNLKYRVNYEPLYDQSYGNYQQGWHYKEITFNTVQPLSVYITGPSTTPCATGTWTANVSGGYSPYSYKWYQMWSCGGPAKPTSTKSGGIKPLISCGTWNPVGTNSATLQMYWCGGDGYLRVDVTDSHNQTASAQYYITGSGGIKPQLSDNSLDALKIAPTVYDLGQNYPNPFNPSTQIKYALKEDGFVNIKVYDILGRAVATLVNENEPAGFYTVNFDASNLSSGIYFYTIKTKNFFDRKKMILLR